jgi:alanine-synthesizing transaminase
VTFSGRIPADLTPNRFAAAVARLRAEGRPLLDLTGSNPTQAGFDYPADLLRSLGQADALRYAPEALGLLSARQAVARDLTRLGMTVEPDAIALTASTSEAYSLLVKLLCDPGDEILIPRPSYPLFEHLTRLDAVTVAPYDLVYHGTWSIDRSSLEDAVAARTRAVLLVSPNNPTGSVTSVAEMEWLGDFCSSRGIAIISDEVFADYTAAATPLRVGLLLQQANVLGFTLGGLSKSIGLPQTKLAWITISGPADDAQSARARLELACDTYLSVSTPVQIAAPELLDRGAAIRHQIQSRLHRNRHSLEQLADGVPACRILHADGGWSAVMQVPSLMSEEDLVIALASDHGVLVHPGYFFDFATESFLVLSLLTPPEVFSDGAGRILHRFSHVHTAP